MKVVTAPELEAALTQQGARRRLATAANRAEQHVNELLAGLGRPLPAETQRALVLPARDGIPVDPDQVVRLTTDQLASVLYAALLDSVATDPALDVPADPRPAPGRTSDDRDAAAAGAQLHTLAADEMLVAYRPRRNTSAEEAIEVEDRLSEALRDVPGGSVLDESGWQWVVRVP